MTPPRRLPAPAALAVAAGLGAGQLVLAQAAEGPWPGALPLAPAVLKLALASLLAWLGCLVVLAVVWERDLAVGRLPGLPALSAFLSEARPRGPAVLGGTAALVAIALLGQPARLVLTLYCYVLLAGVLWWVVRRSAGPRAAAGAVGGLAVLTLVAASAQWPSMRFIEDWRPDSVYKWAVGWPTEAWRLRHTVQLASPGPARPLRLRLFLARPYDGPARVYATVNGRDVPVAQTESELHVEVPAALAGGATRLDLVLRQAPPDPRLRILAARWAQGASLGPAATSFGDGETWLPGTFNDAAGRRQPGVLALHLEGLD